MFTEGVSLNVNLCRNDVNSITSISGKQSTVRTTYTGEFEKTKGSVISDRISRAKSRFQYIARP